MTGARGELHGNIVSGDLRTNFAGRDINITHYAPPPGEYNEACPYPGLRAYEEYDAPRFFGREALVRALLERLERHRFIAVIGPSGSGKSSLVRAGLIPDWRAHDGSATQVASVTLDRNPFLRLMTALASMRSPSGREVLRSPELEFCARPSRDALTRTAALASARGERWLLVLDALEEVLVDAEGAEGRAWFLAELAALARAPPASLSIVVVLQADFQIELSRRARALQLEIKRHGVLIEPMSPEELAQAIDGPAKLHGVDVRPELRDALDKHYSGRHALSELQAALTRVWANELAKSPERGLRDGLERDALESPSELLRQRLERARVAEFPAAAQQHVARQLVVARDGGFSPAPPRPRANFQGADAHRILDRLVEARLVHEAAERVWLAHAELLELWDAFTNLTQESANVESLRAELKTAAERWDRASRTEDVIVADDAPSAPRAGGAPHELLWTGWRLAFATNEDTRAQLLAHGLLSDAEDAFLRASLRQQTRHTRRLYWLLGVTVVALIAATLAALAAQRSARAKELANAREREATTLAQQRADEAEREKVRAEASSRAAERASQAERRAREDAERLITFLLDGTRDTLSRRGGLALLTAVDDEIARYYTADERRASLNHVAALRSQSERLLAEGHYRRASAVLAESQSLLRELPQAAREGCDFAEERVRIGLARTRLLVEIYSVDATLPDALVERIERRLGTCEGEGRVDWRLLLGEALLLRARLAAPPGSGAPPEPVQRDLERATEIAEEGRGATRSRYDELLWATRRHEAELWSVRVYEPESWRRAAGSWQRALEMTEGALTDPDMTWRWRRFASLAGLAELVDKLADDPRDCRALALPDLRRGACDGFARARRDEALQIIARLVQEDPKNVQWRTALARLQLARAEDARDPIERRQRSRAAYETIRAIVDATDDAPESSGAPQVTGYHLTLLFEAAAAIEAPEAVRSELERVRQRARDDEVLVAREMTVALTLDPT
ncbi:MAG: ATP-binding protein [Myxococcales bacterium]|nr:ATP-binding protein [Myxococcales bacterium]